MLKQIGIAAILAMLVSPSAFLASVQAQEVVPLPPAVEAACVAKGATTESCQKAIADYVAELKLQGGDLDAALTVVVASLARAGVQEGVDDEIRNVIVAAIVFVAEQPGWVEDRDAVRAVAEAVAQGSEVSASTTQPEVSPA